MPTKLNTYSISAITKAVQQVPAEQKNSTETYLLTHTDRTIPNSQTLNTLLTTHFPGASLLISDTQVREIRRELSEIAWQAMLAQVAANAVIDRPAGVKHHFGNLFRPDGNEDDRTLNAELRQASAENDLSALAEHYDEYLLNLEPYTSEDFEDLTDEKLVESFPKLYALYLAAQDAAYLLDPANTGDIHAYLSGDSLERLKALSKDMPLFAALMSRFEMICHPNYELVDTTALPASTNAAAKAGAAANAAEADSQDAWFFQTAQTQANRNFDLQLVRQLEHSSFEHSTAKFYDLQQNEFHPGSPSGKSCADALRQGKHLICRNAQGKVIALRPDADKFVETNLQVVLSNAVRDVLTTRANELMALATGSKADPFWLMTGSSQYRDLKNALTSYTQTRQTISDPPKDEELDALAGSLEYLSGAAEHYLQHKDPSITANMTFERYMQQRGNAAGMNEREKIRLQAAFEARDLARDIHSTISFSRELGYKNTQALSADHVFYQGLLRKHAQLEARLDDYLSDTNAAERISQVMSNPDFHQNKTSIRPADSDEIGILLWEMQQVTELIDDTESLMGLHPQDRRLDKQEEARINSSRKFREKDPAALSVEALQEQLSIMVRNAVVQAQQKEPAPVESTVQASGPSLKLQYSPKEFISDKELFESEIARSNSSAEVKTYMNKNKGTAPSSRKKHLEHRAKGLEYIEDLEKNNPSRRPIETYTVYRDGQPVNDEPVFGDKIMLHGVHERRAQTTMNGCWSVSLCSQLEYRGVNLPQEYIRTYRPDDTETKQPTSDFYKNLKQSIADYSGLVSRMLPNSCLFQIPISSPKNNPNAAAEAKAQMQHLIFHALTKENSPVSLCAGGHYLTVVGMDKDRVYVKNPMHWLGGDPETIEEWTFDQLLSKGRGSVELNWIGDLTPSLGGSIEPNAAWYNNGMFYGNGRAYSNFLDEATVPLKPNQQVLPSKVHLFVPNPAEGGDPLRCNVSVFQGINLKYTRIPGSQYNADALKKMQDALSPFRNMEKSGISAQLEAVQHEANKLRSGEYFKNPDEGMLTLAGKYMDALDQLKQQQPDPDVNKLQELMVAQLGQIRTAVMDMQQANYKFMVGSPDVDITYGNEETRPSGLSATDHAERRQAYVDLKKGLAGMIYYHAAKGYALEDRQWIEHLKPKSAKKEIGKIENGDAFRSMVDEIYGNAKKYEYYTGNRYYNYKAFLDNKLGNPMRDKDGAPMTTVPKFPSLANISPDEATRRLDALKQEREQLFHSAQLNPKHYENMPSQYFSQRVKDQERVVCLKDLRISVRDGNTAGLFARYLQHQNKIIQKKAQLNQQEQPQNEGPMLNQEAPQVKQNPEAGNIPMA